MASFEAVRDVSDALVALLKAGVAPLVDANDILLSTPHAYDPVPVRPALTVFLYRITVDSVLLNTPSRRPPDGRATRPLLPIELHYMITAWSKDTRGELAIAGRVLQVLYDRQILGPADLPGDSWEPDESVQLLFESLPIEEHYRVWGTTDVPYRLSLTYVARGVGIAPTEASRFKPVVQAGEGAEADHRPSAARVEAHIAGRATSVEASGFLTYCGAERQYPAQLNRVSA